MSLIKTIKALICLYLFTVGASAVSFAMFEGVDIARSIWWAFTTATTVGYGDISPATTGGMVTGVILMHAVPFLITPLLTAYVASGLIVDRDAFTHEEQEEIKTNIRLILKNTKK